MTRRVSGLHGAGHHGMELLCQTLLKRQTCLQNYAKQITEGLLVTGQDMTGPQGLQLQQDVHEFYALTGAKFRFTPSNWQAPLDGSSDSQAAAVSCGRDPLYMGLRPMD